jgi:HEAT repeat protein
VLRVLVWLVVGLLGLLGLLVGGVAVDEWWQFKKLKDPNPTARIEVIDELANIFCSDSDAVGALINLAKDKDANVRAHAAQGLGKCKDASAIEPLIIALKSDPDPVVRKNASEALHQFTDPRATDALKLITAPQTAAPTTAAAASATFAGAETPTPSSLPAPDSSPATASAPEARSTSDGKQNSLVGHWVCSSSQMPTGLFLFLTLDFRSDGTFHFIDSMQERPPVRVWEGTWEASEHAINIKYRTWEIGSEGLVHSSEAELGYGFIDPTRSAFETTLPWFQGGPVDYICGSSLDDIFARHLLDILKRDIATHNGVR